MPSLSREPTAIVASRQAASVREELALLEEAGVTSCSLWLPVAAEALPDALAWIAAEVM